MAVVVLLVTILLAMWACSPAYAQDGAEGCLGAGSVAAAAILGFLAGIGVLIALLALWNRHRRARQEHLILETDAEKGKGEFAFDNPGFKDAGFSPVNKLDISKKVWPPLTALTAKSEKKRTLDDSAIETNQVKVVALKSHDFTGLGFSICGNMKDGIYIKDVLHRGPASESGKLNSGDRINSVTISFEHMVYEDALTILSYASPYEVIIEAKGGKVAIQHVKGQGAQPNHPIYRSSSCTDLLHAEKAAKKRLFGDDYSGSLSSNYSSLQKSRSNMTTLERKEPSPQNRPKKAAPKIQFSPEQLKAQLEQKILMDHQQNLKNKDQRIEVETQKSTENKFQKFGVRVLPAEQKKVELVQNDNNINIERGIDVVDKRTVPQAKRREKRADTGGDQFERQNSITGSGIKRDKNGIPQEIPSYMMNAAVAARSNRKNSDDKGSSREETPKKKGKAPPPPELATVKANLDEIQTVDDDIDHLSLKEEKSLQEEIEVELRNKENRLKDYNSDSDVEMDNQSSVNTIELNSSDITIHHAEENDDSKQNRRTASTGDLTKIQKNRSNTGTLERAQSLDITDTGIPSLTKKRKGGRIEDSFDMQPDEDLFGTAMIAKEPRLSLILDGLTTFQRTKLKKSTEWGNLEDAILNLSQEDDAPDSPSLELGTKSREFHALVDKINEIKRESVEMDTTNDFNNAESKVKNQIWPIVDTEISETQIVTVKMTKTSPPDVVSNFQMHQQNNLPDFDDVKLETKNETPSPIEAKIQQTAQSALKHHRNVIWPVISDERYEKRQQKPISVRIAPPNDELPTYQSVIDEKADTHPTIPEKKDYILEKVELHRQKLPQDIIINTDGTMNKSDETKTSATCTSNKDNVQSDFVDITRSFIFTEKSACSRDYDDYRYKINKDTNISDDIKVSRHSLGSLERPKSDDAKSLMSNISNVTINSEYNSLDINIEPNSKVSDVSELYTTALDNSQTSHDGTEITINSSDEIKTSNDDVTIQGPSSLTLEIPRKLMRISDNKPPSKIPQQEVKKIVNHQSIDVNTPENSTLTYITEIQVLTPNSTTTTTTTNISEIEIIPNARNLDREFEDYVKQFESNGKLETKIEQQVESDEPKSLIITDTIDAEKELHKIHEIAEEQLKKLPEMRFTTASYEKIPDKRQSQIEVLRSNFEKSPPKKPEAGKSRIPIATTKTPPTSPERRDSRTLDMENDKAILELMSSVHSTPKYQTKPPPLNKNVTITSIRTNSKIPSGLPVLGGSRPPIPPRRQESVEEHVQVSTNGVESSFKQWVFNPENSVTNILVTEEKLHK